MTKNLSKVPYEMVCGIIKNACHNIDISLIFELESEIIESCGWSNEDFDKETLKRINSNWIDIEKSN